MSFEPESVSGDVKLSYDKEHVSIKGKARNNGKEFIGDLAVAPTQYPDLGLKVGVESIADNAVGQVGRMSC